MPSDPTPEQESALVDLPAWGAGAVVVRQPVQVVVDADQVELAADRLLVAGASAVAETPRDDGTVALVADPDPRSHAELRAHFGAAFEPLEVLPDDTGWMAYAVARPVGERLVVRPEWVEPGALGQGRLEIVVHAATAFGSGAHETTALCLELIEELLVPEDRVLDVGSGSGVLGVAAALLGAGRVRCIDVESAAVEATLRTAAASGAAERVHADTTPLAQLVEQEPAFDLVVANLLVPIIEQLGTSLAAATASTGRVVLSGVLVDQEERAAAACAPLQVVDVRRAGRWSALVLARPPE